MEYPTYNTIMPSAVLRDKNLNPMAKILYSEIYTNSAYSVKGYCEMSSATFAILYDVNAATVSRWLESLIKYGYIERVQPDKDGRRVFYRVLK